jgi:exodeoxyribonuclease VII small subunit
MPGFEDRLKRLEQLAESIQEAELPLEEAVRTFEEGMKLSRTLERELSRIERRVEILINNPAETGEKPALDLFPELESDETPDK